MTHQERIRLIQPGVSSPEGLWADLGSGSGAFTLALAELLRPPAEIFSIEEEAFRLKEQQQSFHKHFPDFKVHFIQQDFTKGLQLPPLDGILMANALHYISEKENLVQTIRSHLKNTGCFILVEYHTREVNPWVPYPISFAEWKKLARICGFKEIRLLGKHPSRFQHEIYAACSWI